MAEEATLSSTATLANIPYEATRTYLSVHLNNFLIVEWAIQRANIRCIRICFKIEQESLILFSEFISL